MTIQKCLCLCICEQKLLTNTSKNRNRCSGCFIGNCRGKGLLMPLTIIKTGMYSIPGTMEESDEKDSTAT